MIVCPWMVAVDEAASDVLLRDAVLDALDAAGYTQKAAALESGCDPSWWSKYSGTGTWPLWRLVQLSPRFWRAFLPWLAARVELAVVPVDEARAVEAVIAVARALRQADVAPAERDRVVRAVIAVAEATDPQRRVG